MDVAILAGGKGSRLGFVEKPLLKVCGVRIIERIVSELRPSEIFVVCSKNNCDVYKKLSEELGFEVVVDAVNDFGPCGGIYSALRLGRDLVVVGGDMPFVKRDVVEYIYRTGKKLGCDALIPEWSDGKKEPLLAFYSRSALSCFEKAVSRGERKIMLAVKNARFLRVEELKKFDENLLSFFNVNTAQDLKRAEEICSLTGLVEE